jgi:hypothetical protein
MTISIAKQNQKEGLVEYWKDALGPLQWGYISVYFVISTASGAAARWLVHAAEAPYLLRTEVSEFTLLAAERKGKIRQ